MLDSWSWRLEDRYHILGTKFPLMTAGSVVTVFEAGGLLYVDHEDLNALYIVDEGLTINDFEPVFSGHFIPHGLTLLEGDCTASTDYFRFSEMWAWEWDTSGRNRWQEMKDRGGEVDELWTAEPPNRSWEGYEDRPGPMADAVAALDAILDAEEYDSDESSTDDLTLAAQTDEFTGTRPLKERTLADDHSSSPSLILERAADNELQAHPRMDQPVSADASHYTTSSSSLARIPRRGNPRDVRASTGPPETRARSFLAEEKKGVDADDDVTASIGSNSTQASPSLAGAQRDT